MAYGVINSDLMTTSDGVSSAGLYGFKNRLINGDMRIDQRNAGASVSNVAATRTYCIDRWAYYGQSASKFTVQQTPSATETGYATRVGAGFTNYLAITSSAATTPSSTDVYAFVQRVEGLNVADLAFGTASAAPVTLSFWVNSSLTGTFGGSISNSAADRSYVFSYTISAANTWEQKTVTIPGDTSGTWLTTNGIGIQIWFDIGSGASQKGTANSWSSSFYYGVTGGTNVISTNGATFYITGVQLEKGTTATSFDYRPYGTELALCQRYFRALKSGLIGFWNSSTNARIQCTWLGMRAAPSFSQSGTLTITDNSVNATQSSVSITDNGSDADGGQIIIGNLSGGTANRVAATLSSSAGSILVSAEL